MARSAPGAAGACGWGFGAVCAIAMREASRSTPAPIISLLRMCSLLSYRRNALPDGAFEPWMS